MVFGPCIPLFIILLVLKLTSVIDWSWLWITAPLWATLIVIPVLLVFMIFGLISSASFLVLLARMFWIWPKKYY